jgi:hypothetical protein
MSKFKLAPHNEFENAMLIAALARVPQTRPQPMHFGSVDVIDASAAKG